MTIFGTNIPNLIDWTKQTLRIDAMMKESLTNDLTGKYDEKKLTKFFIIFCMMTLTFLEFFYNGWKIDDVLFYGWMGYAFGNVFYSPY